MQLHCARTIFDARWMIDTSVERIIGLVDRRQDRSDSQRRRVGRISELQDRLFLGKGTFHRDIGKQLNGSQDLGGTVVAEHAIDMNGDCPRLNRGCLVLTSGQRMHTVDHCIEPHIFNLLHDVVEIFSSLEFNSSTMRQQVDSDILNERELF